MATSSDTHFDQLLLAEVWWSAAKRLIAPDARTGSYADLPGYYCAAHAFELYLKHAAQKRGATTQQLKKFDLRHSLSGLCDLVESLDYQVSNPAKEVLSALSTNHSSHMIRYTALKPETRITIFPWERLEEVQTDLLLLTHPSNRG